MKMTTKEDIVKLFGQKNNSKATSYNTECKEEFCNYMEAKDEINIGRSTRVEGRYITNQAIIIDWDNRSAAKNTIKRLASSVSVFIVYHNVNQECSLQELKDIPGVHFHNVKSDYKESSDMYIYGLIVKLNGAGIVPLIVSTDNGYATFCSINGTRCDIIDTLTTVGYARDFKSIYTNNIALMGLADLNNSSDYIVREDDTTLELNSKLSSWIVKCKKLTDSQHKLVESHKVELGKLHDELRKKYTDILNKEINEYKEFYKHKEEEFNLRVVELTKALKDKETELSITKSKQSTISEDEIKVLRDYELTLSYKYEEDYKKDELIQQCKDRNLKTDGVKLDLARRVVSDILNKVKPEVEDEILDDMFNLMPEDDESLFEDFNFDAFVVTGAKDQSISDKPNTITKICDRGYLKSIAVYKNSRSHIGGMYLSLEEGEVIELHSTTLFNRFMANMEANGNKDISHFCVRGNTKILYSSKLYQISKAS